ncbi:hypothetical protein [Sanyastnella coralliicola]|uniref:hypothetical protein n=1 Tax=Sanyastnella coralliicola TaxID=3069118 RepID=UPI0027BA5C8C|nr:hypothetical protein [Longitalea sp. SCSIO 12813]
MKTKILNLLVIATIMLSITSCSKYEEGPVISLRSKTERVANTWVIEKAYDGGEDVTDNYDEYIIQFLSNGQSSLAAIYELGNIQFEYETDGTWEFDNNKEKIIVDYENDDADGTYLILKLYEEELWLIQQGSGVELRLRPM